ELRNVGVELYDKEKEWRSRDGRKGKLFTAGPSECFLTDSEIQDRVYEREDARRSKDFALADSVRDELRSLGVELDDRHAQWQTSGGRLGSYSGVPVVPELRSSDSSGRETREIRKLVCERERHRASQDFQAADDVRRTLSSMGVELFDNERTWRTKSGVQGVIFTGGHEEDCHLTDAAIVTKVAMREDARVSKDYSQADAIREDLRRKGVELLDSQKTWVTTDGRSGTFGGPSSSSSHFQPPRQAAQQSRQGAVGSLAPKNQSVQRIVPSVVSHNSGQGTLSEASIAALVLGRESARDRHDWEAADAIRNDLRASGVDVWDKEKVWKANDGRQGPILRP
ncbi:unnamed protein product, partial [Polarella glacialis]